MPHVQLDVSARQDPRHVSSNEVLVAVAHSLRFILFGQICILSLECIVASFCFNPLCNNVK